MPDRTIDTAKRRESNRRCQARHKARLRAERQAADQAAKVAHRTALDAARVAKGLPPVQTSTQRSIERRARLAREAESVRAQQELEAEASTRRWDDPWFAGGAAEANAYLARIHPNEDAELISRLVEKLTVDCAIHGLPFNRFVCYHGIHGDSGALAARALQDKTARQTS